MKNIPHLSAAVGKKIWLASGQPFVHQVLESAHVDHRQWAPKTTRRWFCSLWRLRSILLQQCPDLAFVQGTQKHHLRIFAKHQAWKPSQLSFRSTVVSGRHFRLSFFAPCTCAHDFWPNVMTSSVLIRNLIQRLPRARTWISKNKTLSVTYF